MTNTQKYYEAVREWRKGMREVEAAYQQKLKELEPYKGSEGYRKAMAELDKVRSDAVETARKEYRGRFKAIIGDMKNTYANKPMKAPTTEQLNLLQALKLRSTVSRDEMRRAANTMKDCPAALNALCEIGKNLGVPVGVTQEIGGDAVASSLRTLESRTAKMLSLNKVDDRRTHANGFLSDSYDLFQVDTDPTDEADCMRIMGLAADPAGFAEMVNEVAE